METVLKLAGTREVFWDDYLIDAEKTTAQHRVHRPVEQEVVMTYDRPWEGNKSNYQNILVEPDGLLRMYYLGWQYTPPAEGEKAKPLIVSLCYAESRDGIHWTRPELDICTWENGEKTNILIDGRTQTDSLDGFYVFRDDNPACPPEERYKGVMKPGGTGLWCFTSADGIHFEKSWLMVKRGWFDTLNTVHWDPVQGVYRCFTRGFHDSDAQQGIRDIRCMWSKDFREWSEQVPLDFMGSEDYPLYTNCVSVYRRAPQLFVGFPSRYIDHDDWPDNYKHLCGLEARKIRGREYARYGTAVTDCVFMCSRDGQAWKRYDEAFMTAGPENPDNWVYGDCYPAAGIVETPGRRGAETELSMYSLINQWSMKRPTQLVRYTLRKEGFVSLNAPYAGATVVTRPFVFGGKGLAVNFATSARGYLYVTLTAEDGTVARSDAIFGDSCDRVIDFDIDLAAFAGKETVMEIRMRDADLYSVKFD